MNNNEITPEGITVIEEEDNLQIIYKYNITLKVICTNLIFMILPLLIMWAVNLLANQVIPPFALPIIFIAMVFSFFLMGISRSVIEINNRNISVSIKPVSKGSIKNIPLSDINTVFYEVKAFAGIVKICYLKALLKNGKKVIIIKGYPEAEEQIKFIQSVIQKRLGLEERKIIA
jgi:hypothetical protein